MPTHRQSVTALAGLTAVILISILPIATWIAPGDSAPQLLLHECVWWSYAAGAVLWLRFGEGLPLDSIGLRWTGWKGILWGLAAAAALIAVFIVHFGLIVPMLHLDSSRAGAERNLILSRPFWYRLILVLRASVVEEILFRGYIIEKVRQLTGSTALAVIVSVAAFTYAHLSGWGLVHLIPVFAGGVIFALLYIRRRDLPSNMLAHFISDGIGFLG
jgi:membrane protease YdiL (CAAX protease family)